MEWVRAGGQPAALCGDGGKQMMDFGEKGEEKNTPSANSFRSSAAPKMAFSEDVQSSSTTRGASLPFSLAPDRRIRRRFDARCAHK